MSDKKVFPSAEPPPHPESEMNAVQTATPVVQTQNPNASNTEVNSPLSVLETEASAVATEASSTTQTQNVSQVSQAIPQNEQRQLVSKKGPPKILIFVMAGLLLIVGILLLVVFIRSRGSGTLVGTKGEIAWWGMEEDFVVAPLIDEFQNQNPNVRIKYLKQSEKDYRERLTNSLASGQGPDVFEIHNSWTPMFKADMAALPGQVMSKEDYVKSFYPVITSSLTSGSDILGIPLEYDALTLYINEEIFTLALRTPPQNWDELKKLADTRMGLTQRDQSGRIIQSAVALGITDNIDYWPEIIALMMIQNGADLNKPTNGPIQDAIVFYVRYKDPDRVWDSTLPESTTAFAKGQLAMYFGSAKSATEIKKLNPNLRFRTVTLPQIPKEKPTDPDFSYATFWAQAVWKRSKNTEVAWNFLKFMSTESSLQKLNESRSSNNVMEKAYPRPSMAILQKDDKILGSIVALAPAAKSWYLADKTNDGATGINSQINEIFKGIIGLGNRPADIGKAVPSLPDKINKVLAKFNKKR